MSNWFEKYDDETYMTNFNEIKYCEYNPLSDKNKFAKSHAFDLVIQ